MKTYTSRAKKKHKEIIVMTLQQSMQTESEKLEMNLKKRKVRREELLSNLSNY